MKRLACACAAIACLLISLSACAGRQAQRTTNAPAEVAGKPLPAETNPPGDIGDTQAFVRFRSRDAHFSIEYPEGWSQSTHGGETSFIRDFDGERVRAGTVRTATRPFAVVRDVHSSAMLPAGKATLIVFSSNSAPNAVTGKQVRLTNNTYVFPSERGTFLLDLWAPLGTDNVDQWHRIAQSFRTK